MAALRLTTGQSVYLAAVGQTSDFVDSFPQTTVLFNMSILDNVRYAKLDATDEEVHEVCRAAALHGKILTFRNGYHTKVGEQGVKLFGGEMQPVAIASVIWKDP
ncbi:hypothetical protein DV737_g1919, partial [Chaetothyriales sp. CBS 132003]